MKLYIEYHRYSSYLEQKLLYKNIIHNFYKTNILTKQSLYINNTIITSNTLPSILCV